MSELPIVRRRKTAQIICAYLEAEPTAARIELLMNVLKAGELELLVREITIQEKLQTPKWWEYVEACKVELRKVRDITESFFIQTREDDHATR